MAEAKLDLDETGTRFQHYNELRELFDTGLNILNNVIAGGKATTTDREMRVKLTNAIFLIDARLLLLGNFDKTTGYSSSIRKQVDSIPRTLQLTEGTNDTPAGDHESTPSN